MLLLYTPRNTQTYLSTPRGFKGSGTVHNFKPWCQGRANITTSCARHVIIFWAVSNVTHIKFRQKLLVNKLQETHKQTC